MNKVYFHSSQCRVARGLLNLSQQALAEAAHITHTTVARFENDERAPSHNNLQAIRTALEAAGITLVPGNGGGPGARLSDPHGDGDPGDAVLSPALCRAGRNLLDLSQEDLAETAGLGRSTVADFERGARTPSADNLATLRATLETAGAVFIPADKTAGRGVRLKK